MNNIQELMVGNSPAMQRTMEEVNRVAQHDIPVMLLGERGVGKTLIAGAIHQLSLRRSNRFFEVNCATIVNDLAGSSLFGHHKGAFTSAYESRKGYVLAANNGTLFLDEVGDLPLQIQAMLLQVFNGQMIRAVGSEEEISVDFRLITATNMDPPELIRHKRLRSDFFDRIAKYRIYVPSLRHRVPDIMVLARKIAGSEAAFEPGAIQALEDYHWPGNVRELENVVDAAKNLYADRKGKEFIIQKSHIEVAIHYAGSIDSGLTAKKAAGIAGLCEELLKSFVAGELSLDMLDDYIKTCSLVAIDLEELLLQLFASERCCALNVAKKLKCKAGRFYDWIDRQIEKRRLSCNFKEKAKGTRSAA